MRVCHVNLSREFRGGERQTLTLVHALSGRIDQRVVVRRDAPLQRALAEIGLPRTDIVPVANSPIAAILASRGAELLHVHDGRSVQVGAARSLLGTPFIATRRVLKQPKTGRATRWAYGRAKAIVAVSDAVGRAMRAYGILCPVQTIHDCVPTLPPPNAERLRGLRNMFRDRVVVGQVGQLDDVLKGQRTVLEVARRLEGTRPALVFLLVGGGKDASALRSEAQGLSNVYFAGWTDRVSDYYAAMDIFAFPSRSEALGSSLLEAMTFSLPILASTAGGIPEIVKEGVNGLLFDPDDIERFSDLLVHLADDAGLRQRLGAGGRAMAASLSPGASADQYCRLYEAVIAAEQMQHGKWNNCG